MKRLCYSVAKGCTGQELEARVSDGALTSVLKGLRNLLAELFTLSWDHTTLFFKKKIKPLTILSFCWVEMRSPAVPGTPCCLAHSRCSKTKGFMKNKSTNTILAEGWKTEKQILIIRYPNVRTHACSQQIPLSLDWLPVCLLEFHPTAPASGHLHICFHLSLPHLSRLLPYKHAGTQHQGRIQKTSLSFFSKKEEKKRKMKERSKGQKGLMGHLPKWWGISSQRTLGELLVGVSSWQSSALWSP